MSWVPTADAHADFTLANLPFGIFSVGDGAPSAGIAIGATILDLHACAKVITSEKLLKDMGLFDMRTQSEILTHTILFKAGLFDGIAEKEGAFWASIFGQPTLNAFMALRRPQWRAVRERAGDLLRAGSPDQEAVATSCLVEQAAATMHLPASIGDYTDF